MHDIFYFTDIHGSRLLFDAVMNYCREQDDEAMIIFGGDAIDRGEDGYAIMKELLDNPKVVYLKGNHEDMFVKAAYEIKEKLKFTDHTYEEYENVLKTCCYFDYKYAAIQNSIGNGGIHTLVDWIEDGMPMNIIEQVENLPLTFSYDTLDICHAGSVYPTFKEVATAEYDNKEIDEILITSLLWSRTTLDVGWAPNRTAIFGHTPVLFLPDYTDLKFPKDMKVQPVKYTSTLLPNMTGEKIDMDTGAIFTNRIFVLNLLTMKAQGFENGEKIECVQL